MPAFKKTLYLLLAFVVVGYNSFLIFEGGLVSAQTQTDTESVTSTLNFPVTLTVSSEIKLTCPVGPVTMGTISGLTGGTASTTADCNVATNNSSGYQMWVHATNTPAMISDSNPADEFGDYASSPEYTWSIATNEAEFGFAASSTDVVTAFKNDGASACGGSVIEDTKCFRGFSGTTDVLVASRASETGVNGVTSTLRFYAEIGTVKNQPSGAYRATVVVTAAVQ